MGVRPNRIDRTPAVPVWLFPQQGKQQPLDKLTLRKVTPPTNQVPPIIYIEQEGSTIAILPEFVEEVVDRLRSARDWEEPEQ